MKHFLFILLVVTTFSSCTKEGSCFSDSGNSVSKTLSLSAFDVIDIPKGFTVEIIESNESKIEIDSKESYLANLDFQIQNNQLTITNSMSCSMLHSYEIAKVRIYTPTLKKIISRTQLKVSSVGILRFPELTIITSSDEGASSKVDLQIENNVLRVEDNQVGYFKISGKTIWLDIAFYGGSGRLEAQNLEAFDCTFFQRSNNDILVKAENKLSGTIYATGNVIVFNKPNEVDVTEKYKGKLIYK
ncbi:GIN domain-containing protein [Flavobacterium sp. I3-2]|uniref:GIN domain-containing protein n=1 Tax=Flavobacterium sp. I3-2 TaxID=2748319 RepID=UPI0015AEC8D5|nr:DUF2807 domain-containing protein [Flavobacterium sp. I3-2]